MPTYCSCNVLPCETNFLVKKLIIKPQFAIQSLAVITLNRAGPRAGKIGRQLSTQPGWRHQEKSKFTEMKHVLFINVNSFLLRYRHNLIFLVFYWAGRKLTAGLAKGIAHLHWKTEGKYNTNCLGGKNESSV